MYQRGGKRIFDILVVLLASVILIPILAVVALLVRVKLGAPVLFRQVRPGLNLKPFTAIKFRSMTDARDADGNLLSDGDRLTEFGAFLRKYSLDELPGFWNVLTGDVSLVGPRPMLFSYFQGKEEQYAKRHSVRPGITGWAQVNGRNTLPYRKRFEYDNWYVDHLSFALDLKILFLTVIQIFKTEDVALWEPEIDDLGLKTQPPAAAPPAQQE